MSRKRKNIFVFIKMKMADLCCLINGDFCQRLSEQRLLEKKTLKHCLCITVMIITSVHTILVKLEVIKDMLIFTNTVQQFKLFLCFVFRTIKKVMFLRT